MAFKSAKDVLETQTKTDAMRQFDMTLRKTIEAEIDRMAQEGFGAGSISITTPTEFTESDFTESALMDKIIHELHEAGYINVSSSVSGKVGDVKLKFELPSE